MNQNHPFLANILRQGSNALAGYASAELLEKHPEAGKGFPRDPFIGWQNWLTTCLEELSAAVGVDRPRLFVSQMRLGQAAFQARGIASEQYRNALLCLRAVLASELPEKCRPIANQYVDKAIEALDEPGQDISNHLLSNDAMGQLASAFLVTLFEGNRRRAIQMILEASEQGIAIRDLYLQVLLPAQNELGRMWLANEINVAEEHFATQTTKMVMSRLLARAEVKPANGKTMLAASVAGNLHDLGLQAVADFFEMDGWRTVMLGADVPSNDLVEAVDFFRADLLGISVSQTTQMEDTKKTIQAVRASERGEIVKVLIGGQAFMTAEDLSQELGADGYAGNAAEAVVLGRHLVGLL